jgi:hypothetical protein
MSEPERQGAVRKKVTEKASGPAVDAPAQPPGERGGPKGPEPTRFGDWEKNGRCFDF